MQMNPAPSRGRFIAPTADLSALILLCQPSVDAWEPGGCKARPSISYVNRSLTQQYASTQDAGPGFRRGEGGGEWMGGPLGSPALLGWHALGGSITLRAGDPKGPPHRPSSTLAPTEYPTPFH